jgi:glc operon protein GlcG
MRAPAPTTTLEWTDRDGRKRDNTWSSRSELRSIVDRTICTATFEGGRMSSEKIGTAVIANRALQPTGTNPLDFVPGNIPFDTPYWPADITRPSSGGYQAAVAEAKKRNWKINVVAVDSGSNLVAFHRIDGAMLASIQIAKHKARAAATFRRETKQFEDGIQLMHLNYLLTFDWIIASRGGIPLIEQGVIFGAIGCLGGTDSQDEIISKMGAAVINQLPPRNE